MDDGQRFGLTKSGGDVTDGTFEALAQLTDVELLGEPGRKLGLHEGPHLVARQATVVEVRGIRADALVTHTGLDALRQLVVRGNLDKRSARLPHLSGGSPRQRRFGPLPGQVADGVLVVADEQVIDT